MKAQRDLGSCSHKDFDSSKNSFHIWSAIWKMILYRYFGYFSSFHIFDQQNINKNITKLFSFVWTKWKSVGNKKKKRKIENRVMVGAHDEFSYSTVVCTK